MAVLATIFGLFSALGPIFDGAPGLRLLWRWALERQMEVTILPQLWRQGRDKAIIQQVAIELDERSGPPYATFHFALRLTNHRSERIERIIGARVVFKRKRLWFWRKDIVSIPVFERSSAATSGPPITDLAIEPMAAPTEIQCVAEGSFDDSIRVAFPRRFDAKLVLDMVGPIRRMERQIIDYTRPGANLWDRLKPSW